MVKLICKVSFLQLMLLVWLPMVVSAQNPIPTGVSPWAVAVNPVTNKIYVVNHIYNPATVTVIDGATGTSEATVGTGSTATYSANAVAVNPRTNKIYVTNSGSGNVTVIDGATGSVGTVINTGAYPCAVAVNVESNKIYVANKQGNSVTVIDGSTDAITTIDLGVKSAPWALAVNPVTNKVYVAHNLGDSITVIDGFNGIKTIPLVADPGVTPVSPEAVAVNPGTNKVYVANYNGTVTIINGNTDTVLNTVGVVGGNCYNAVAVNPKSNLAYAVNYIANSGSVSVIDDTNTIIKTVATGGQPVGLTVNPVSGKVYVANNQSGYNSVTVIDGGNNFSVSTLNVGAQPRAVAVNLTTNTVYVANNFSNNVTVIAETPVPLSPLLTTVSPLVGDTTTTTTPTFTLTAASSTGSPVRTVYYQVDTQRGVWLAATPAVGYFSATTSPLTSGAHTIYVLAVDGNDSTSINSGSQSSPLVGAIASYTFTVIGVSPVTYKVTPVNTSHGSITPLLQQVVEFNKTISFTVTPDNGYTILSVTGCGGTLVGNSYTTAPITADCTVTPTFSSTLLPVRIGTSYYQTLLQAYAAATSGDLIQATESSFSGGLNLNRLGITVTLQGGYDGAYVSRPGSTTVVGVVTVAVGTLVADQLTVQ